MNSLIALLVYGLFNMIDDLDGSMKSIEFIIQDQFSTQSSPTHSQELQIQPQEINHQEELPNHQIDIRERYLSKLKQNGLLFDKPRKKCHHITIFDWDDTLFCTTHLQKYSILYMSQVSKSDYLKIQQLDSKVSQILSIAAELSLVYIITNAVQGWVQYCLKHFMPRTKQIVKQFRIIIISARSRYEQKFPWESQQWKIKTFKDILDQINKNLITLNMTCIGDSTAQLKAAEQLVGLFSKQILKTIKLYEKPRMDQLCKQLNLLHQNIKKIIISTKNMQIKLQKK